MLAFDTRPSWHEVISGWPSRDKFDGHDRATVALDGSVVTDNELVATFAGGGDGSQLHRRVGAWQRETAPQPA